MILSHAQVEWIAERLYETSPHRYMPVWKAKEGVRDGRLDPREEVRQFMRLLNAMPRRASRDYTNASLAGGTRGSRLLLSAL